MSDAKKTSLEAQRLAERAAQALSQNDKTARHLGILLVEIRPRCFAAAPTVSTGNW